MSRYLLDTETITLAQFGHAVVFRNVAAHPATDIVLSTVSFQEQMGSLRGRLFPIWRQFELLPFPLPAIQRFQPLRALRLNVGAMDLRLAAVALEHGLTVVTRNVRDFQRIPGVQTEDWSV